MDAATFRDHFIQLGLGNYIAGRFAVRAGLSPTAGTLIHHAVEMFLKAAVCDRLSVADLKKIGHKIDGLWRAFKNGDATLDRFDDAIARLDAFETLRYPDDVAKRGAATVIGWGRNPNAIVLDGGTKMPQYELALNDYDELVVVVLDRASINPKALTPFNEGARENLMFSNPHAGRWLPPPHLE